MPSGGFKRHARRPLPSRSTWPTGDPRQTVVRSAYQDGPGVLPLPVVSTVGVNGNQAGTAANVSGSVNPNGSATSWWISYGTTLPLPGTNTTATEIGNGTTPLTVSFQVGNLTTGTTYYFAVVGESAAGTVYGQTIAFVPTPTAVITPSALVSAQTIATIPHFDVPFALITSGPSSGAIVVDQDTIEEVLACVATVASCGIGQCDVLPTFGIPQETFLQGPPDTTRLVDAISLWEPRATEDVVTELLADGTNWGITLSTSYSGAQ